MPITTCVFDAYGTLFDVSAAARMAAQDPALSGLSGTWADLAEDWRRKQLEYSWLRAITKQHCDFWQVTKDGLDWAMDARGLKDPAMRKRLLQLYRELDAYPEVADVLARLREMGKATAILSNGSPGMLADAVTSADLSDRLDAVISVEDIGIFKPSAKVYDLVGEHFVVRPQDVLFVSSNGWDAAAAASYGFRVAWVNRRGDPADRMPGLPDHILSNLTQILDLDDI